MTSFASLHLRSELLFSLQALGYTIPSASQLQLLPPLLSGRNLITQARSGTGKSLAFILAALQVIDLDELSPQVIILTPTHELAIQTGEVVGKVGDAMKVVWRACYGGTDVHGDIEALSQGVQVVVGTLGRVYDMISHHRLETEKVKLIVIDEADMLGHKKYRKYFEYIMDEIPENTQIAFVSTTFPEKFKKFALTYLSNPLKIIESLPNLCPKNVSQYFIPLTRNGDRLPTLLSLLNQLQGRKVLVFCKSLPPDFQAQLQSTTLEIHFHYAEMSQSSREKAVSAFRKKSSIVLVNTGLLGRGLDVTDIAVVVMYEMGSAVEYVHCVGRVGRFGGKGMAISLANEAERKFLRNVERRHKVKVRELPEDRTGVW
jgi:superfamily II DNA/RNA helicase